MVVVVDIPIENSFDAIGCRKAGKQIISSFPDKYFSETNKEIGKEEIIFKEFLVEGLDTNSSRKKVLSGCKEIFNDENGKIIFIGGDHSITYLTANAFLDNCLENNEEPCLIVFDAHADCTSYNVHSKELPNNVQWIRALVENGFPTNRIILVGIRALTKEESDFLLENNIRVYRMKDMIDFQEICDIIMELANKSKIYISVDIDVVDSAFVPGTARPESGGMTSRQLVYFLQRLNILKGVKAIDIVEINPDKDLNNVTVDFGLKILGEII